MAGFSVNLVTSVARIRGRQTPKSSGRTFRGVTYFLGPRSGVMTARLAHLAPPVSRQLIPNSFAPTLIFKAISEISFRANAIYETFGPKKLHEIAHTCGEDTASDRALFRVIEFRGIIDKTGPATWP